MSKFRPVASASICEAIEQYGRDARVALPLTERAAYQAYERDDHFACPPAMEIAFAADLAVARIRELEDKVSHLHRWQDSLLAVLREHEPTDRAAENWMGWRLFCEGARDSYQYILSSVKAGIADRDRIMAERESEFLIPHSKETTK